MGIELQGKMLLLHKLLIIASTGISLLALFVFGWLLVAWSFNAYPLGALVFLPWGFGLLGVVGLLRAWPEPETKSALRLRIDVALLGMGIAAALLFVLLILVVLGSSFTRTSGASIALWLMFAAVFPGLPLVLACVEVRKSMRLIPAKPLLERAKLRQVWALLFAGSVVFVAARVLAQEAVMLWYGFNMVPAAYASAEALAGGKPYCVIDRAGVAATFEELDKRRILLDAVEKSRGFRGFNSAGKDPHFGIAVEGTFYWWSFRLREFRELPGRNALVRPVGNQCE